MALDETSNKGAAWLDGGLSAPVRGLRGGAEADRRARREPDGPELRLAFIQENARLAADLDV